MARRYQARAEATRPQGLRLLTGKVASIAELIPDTVIQDEDGVSLIINHFETRYADVLTATTYTELGDLI